MRKNLIILSLLLITVSSYTQSTFIGSWGRKGEDVEIKINSNGYCTYTLYGNFENIFDRGKWEEGDALKFTYDDFTNPEYFRRGSVYEPDWCYLYSIDHDIYYKNIDCRDTDECDDCCCLVGKWLHNSLDYPEEIEIFEDGKFINHKNNKYFSGTWEFINIIKVNFYQHNPVFFTIEKDKLYWIGTYWYYTKIE